MRAALYARYSTDRQREASTADQLRVCRQRAENENWTVVAIYADDGISGSIPVSARAGGAALMADALAGRLDVLVVEGLDRLSRDQVQQELVVRRLEHLGIRLVGVSDGYDSTAAARKIVRGVRGLINEIYLDDVRAKVHRGLSGLALRGLHAGGLSYGYRSIALADGHRLEIDEPRAEWVRWIFEHYANGWSPRRIAHELNALGAPAPRGGSWAVSALHGHPKYGTGILRNELYRGVYHWNRSQWVKDPDTGRRRRLERPRHEWHTMELPALRIVPEDLWQAVRARLTGPKRSKPGRPVRTALSGLLRCGHCGGSVTAVDARAYGCTAAKDRGPTVCAGVRVRRPVLEARLIEILHAEMLNDAALAELRREVARLQAEEHRSQASDAHALQSRLAVVERELERLTDAIAVAGWSESINARLKKAEAERAEIRARLAAAPAPPPPALIPRLIERYRSMVEALPGLLVRDPQAARAALGEVLGSVELTEVDGHVYARLPDFGALLLSVVAGDRFHTTKRAAAPAKLYRVA